MMVMTAKVNIKKILIALGAAVAVIVALIMLLGAGVAVQYGVAAVGFFAGVALAVLYDRRIKSQGGLVFTITRLF